uniref:Proline rich transmembrane protein 4a n=1 Tax=Amphilophus citrinellus TaxID=61819 RepID=A0A3Q0T768_AMPCI
MIAPEDEEFLGLPLSWPLSSSEDADRQGVIGEYSDLQDSTETSLLFPNEKGPMPRPTEGAKVDTTSMERMQTMKSSSASAPPKPTQEQTLKNQPAETNTASILYPTETVENQPTFPAFPNEMTDSQLPFLLPGSLTPSHTPDQNSASLLPTGPRPDTLGWTTGISVTTKGNGDGFINITDLILHRGRANMEAKEGKNDTKNDSKARGPIRLDGNMNTFATTCKTLNHSWTPTHPEDFTPNKALHPSLALSPSFLVPLYSDWNSALATWGFAWEAHIYGLGSVFTVFGLISAVCLLGLPLRCPPGSPYFTLLHLFILAFAGIQAFCLLYDAYSYQDRLSPAVSLLLAELPLPCLISAFSLALLLLSLRSRNLPTVILLFPQGLFVCLTIFLSSSYLIFYCLTQVNSRHIYRLNDNGESGGSPEAMRPASCPFASMKDWGRAAGAGVGTSLCLLGCGGLQLYGILHSLGLGGVDGHGFQPWPWWGYQVGCRLCEVGVCLGLSVIGTHPLFCTDFTNKTLTHPRPGSWSRLSCGSPSRMLTITSQDSANSPVLSQGKQEKLVVCDLVTKEQSEVLPLCSIVEPPGNRPDYVHKPSLNKTILPLPTPQNPSHKPTTSAESRLSSLANLGLETDSTVDLRPPSPINLSRSIDQALFSESLLSLSSPTQGTLKQGSSSVGNTFYRTSSCGDVDQENAISTSRYSQPHDCMTSRRNQPLSPEQWDWKGSVTGSTQGLCSHSKETGKLRSHSWANRGQNFAQSSLPRAIPHLPYHRRYRTLSLASQDSQGSSRLAGTKHLSESKQLEWDLAVQAEFVSVCRQIDALSVCSDTIEL